MIKAILFNQNIMCNDAQDAQDPTLLVEGLKQAREAGIDVLSAAEEKECAKTYVTFSELEEAGAANIYVSRAMTDYYTMSSAHYYPEVLRNYKLTAAETLFITDKQPYQRAAEQNDIQTLLVENIAEAAARLATILQPTAEMPMPQQPSPPAIAA